MEIKGDPTVTERPLGPDSEQEPFPTFCSCGPMSLKQELLAHFTDWKDEEAMGREITDYPELPN